MRASLQCLMKFKLTPLISCLSGYYTETDRQSEQVPSPFAGAYPSA